MDYSTRSTKATARRELTQSVAGASFTALFMYLIMLVF